MSVRLSICSCKHNSSLTDEPILMKLYAVAVHNLKMCVKEDNPNLNYLKGGNSNEDVKFFDSYGYSKRFSSCTCVSMFGLLLYLQTQLENDVHSLKCKIQSLQTDLDNSEAVQRDFVKLSQSLQVTQYSQIYIFLVGNYFFSRFSWTADPLKCK